MTPRIAFFTDSFHEVNGVALTSRQFESYARRHALPMFSCHAGPETKSWQDGSITRYEWQRSRAGIQIEADLSFDLLFWRQRNLIREELERFRPDYVHVTSPGDCSLLGVLLAHELKIPVAASWHTNVHEFGARRLQRMIPVLPGGVVKAVEHGLLDVTLLFYSIARLLFAPNPELVQLLETRLGKPCGLMSRGIDTSVFSPARRLPCNRKFRIGYVGRLSAEKSLLEFVELERMLLDKGYSEFEVVFVGHGSVTETLRARMKNARFTGVLKGEALASAYADFDVFVFPSRTDTFGNVILEALASGVPAVVTDEGGPQYLVCEGQTGFVTRDTAEMALRVGGLIEDAHLRTAMSRAAREYALSRHDWDSVFASVYDHYQRWSCMESCAAPVALESDC